MFDQMQPKKFPDFSFVGVSLHAKKSNDPLILFEDMLINKSNLRIETDIMFDRIVVHVGHHPSFSENSSSSVSFHF